jgi:hypothetical protein
MVKSVKSETREIMHDHFQTRLPELKVRRVNDICYMETFFSSAPLLRGFTCWNLFCFIQTGLGMIYLMWHRSQSPTTLPRMITDCGAPTDMKSDNFLFLSLRGSDGLHTWKVCRWRRSTPKPIIQTIILRNNAAERWRQRNSQIIWWKSLVLPYLNPRWKIRATKKTTKSYEAISEEIQLSSRLCEVRSVVLLSFNLNVWWLVCGLDSCEVLTN